ncbi:MAG TPA: hypothetical protein VGN12_04160 [Pirellulales bacterium]
MVTSKRMSLAELATALGRPPQAGSHDKGARHPSGKSWDVTIWRANSLDPSAALEVQSVQLLNDMPSACADLLATSPDDITVTLDVAVYFLTPYSSSIISPAMISALAGKGIQLEITSYPIEPTS